MHYGAHQEAAPNMLVGVFYWFAQLRESSFFSIGDLNIDSEVNVIDVVILANIIIEDIIPNNTQIALSDLNTDDTNDILDIILLVNFILSN